jgi:hypothetical protein
MSDQVKQPEPPVAYGVFAFVDGAWWMQFPVYESEAKAHESYAMYAPGSALLTKPLYDAQVASHAAEVEALRSALQGLMDLESRGRIMPIGREWDAARAALKGD